MRKTSLSEYDLDGGGEPPGGFVLTSSVLFRQRCKFSHHTACSDTDDELDASEIQSMTINRPSAPIIAPSGEMLYRNSCSKLIKCVSNAAIGRSTIAPDVTIFNDDLPTDGGLVLVDLFHVVSPLSDSHLCNLQICRPAFHWFQ